jgi:hypothetical protein
MRARAEGPRVRVSGGAGGGLADREYQYDLLTAALLGVTLGVGATLLLRRGPSGRRPISPALAGALRGAAWAGRGAADLGRRGARWARQQGGELWDRIPFEAAQEQLEDYLHRARESIDSTVESELHDLRKALRRQRRRLGI